MEHMVDFPNGITTGEEHALFYSTLGCCLLSMITSLLALLTYFGIRSYDKWMVNRLSFRLIAYINVIDIAFSLFLVLSFERVAGTGFGCSFSSWGIVCFGLMSAFIRCMMAYHLHFVVRNKSFRNSERTYWLLSIGLSLAFSLAAVIFNKLGIVEWRKQCWYRAIGSWEGIIWSWCTLYIPWVACILYSAFILSCTIIEIRKPVIDVHNLDQYDNANSYHYWSGRRRRFYQWLQRSTGIASNHVNTPIHSYATQDPPQSPSELDVHSSLSDVTVPSVTVPTPVLTSPTGQHGDRDQSLPSPGREFSHMGGQFPSIVTQSRINHYRILYKPVLRVSWYPLIPFICQILDIASQIASFATRYHEFPLYLIAYIALALQGTLTSVVFFTDPIIVRSWRLLKRDLVTVFYFEYEWLKFCEEQLHVSKESRMYRAVCSEFSVDRNLRRRSSALEKMHQWLHHQRSSLHPQAPGGNGGTDYPAATLGNARGFPIAKRKNPHLSNTNAPCQSTCPTFVNDPSSSFPASSCSALNAKKDLERESIVGSTHSLESSSPSERVSNNAECPTLSHQATVNPPHLVPSIAVPVPVVPSLDLRSYQIPNRTTDSQLAQAPQDPVLRQSPTRQTNHQAALSIAQPEITRRNSLLGSHINDAGTLHSVSYSWPLAKPRDPFLPYKDDPRFRCPSDSLSSSPRDSSSTTYHSPTNSTHVSRYSESIHTTVSQQPSIPDLNEIRLRRFKHWRREAQSTRISRWCETRFPGNQLNQPLTGMSGTPPFRIPTQHGILSDLLSRAVNWFTRTLLITKQDVELLDYILCKNYSSAPSSATSTSSDPPPVM